MDRTREKHAAVVVTTLNRPTKTKLKQRPGQSVRRGSGRGKRARVESDDERDAEDEGGQDLQKCVRQGPCQRRETRLLAACVGHWCPL